MHKIPLKKGMLAWFGPAMKMPGCGGFAGRPFAESTRLSTVTDTVSRFALMFEPPDEKGRLVQ